MSRCRDFVGCVMMRSGLPAVTIGLILLCGMLTVADDEDKGFAIAPAGADKFESTFEGTWYIGRELKKRYDAWLLEVRDIEQRVLNGKISPSEARDALAGLRKSLAKLREQIDRQKKLVSAFQIVTQEIDGTIELGPERLLVVTADRIRLVGWDKPHLKYVVRKKVLSTGKSVDDHLAGIKVVHEHRVASDLVGRTDAEMKAWRDDFLNPEDGKTQSAEERKQKEATWERYFAGGERHQPFVGREVDTLRIEGLTWQEGNQHLSYEIKSPEGAGRTLGGRWRRNADVTLFVPACKAILLRGCRIGMEISGVNAHLIMTSAGSQDRDYNGRFSIRDHTGPLTLLNVPMDVIEGVIGDVNITATVEMANTGSRHSNGNWVMYTPPPKSLRIADVDGNLTAQLNRSELKIEAISGVVNVFNEFGDTRWSLEQPLVVGNHRAVSRSGIVRVSVTGEVELGLPVFAATNCGTAATNLGRRQLDDLSVENRSSTDGFHRAWRSLHTKLAPDDIAARLELHRRPEDILADRERSHGLDLISVSGRVEFRREN